MNYFKANSKFIVFRWRALVEDHRAGDLICTQCGLVVGDRYELKKGSYLFLGCDVFKTINFN